MYLWSISLIFPNQAALERFLQSRKRVGSGRPGEPFPLAPVLGEPVSPGLKWMFPRGHDVVLFFAFSIPFKYRFHVALMSLRFNVASMSL